MALVAFALTCVSVYPLFLFRPRMRAFADRRHALHGRGQ